MPLATTNRNFSRGFLSGFAHSKRQLIFPIEKQTAFIFPEVYMYP